MRGLRVGVIRCGYWGPNLIRNFVELPEVDLVCVADLRPERLAHIRSRYPGKDNRECFPSAFRKQSKTVRSVPFSCQGGRSETLRAL